MPIYRGICPVGGEIIQNLDPKLRYTGQGQPTLPCPLHHVDVPVKEAET